MMRPRRREGNASMTDTLDPLVLDLLEWIDHAPRSYTEVMEAWRRPHVRG